AGPKQGPPPIELSFRKAQIPTRGMVVGIKNAADGETLEKLTVEVRSPGEETPRSHVIKTGIKPHDSITVGWVELDGWKLKPGDEFSIKVSRYSEPKNRNGAQAIGHLAMRGEQSVAWGASHRGPYRGVKVRKRYGSMFGV